MLRTARYLAVRGKNFLSLEFWTKFPGEAEVHKLFFYNRVEDMSKEASMPKTSSICSTVSIDLRQTDRHRAIATVPALT